MLMTANIDSLYSFASSMCACCRLVPKSIVMPTAIHVRYYFSTEHDIARQRNKEKYHTNKQQHSQLSPLINYSRFI